MSKSQRVSQAQIRRAFRLIGEACEVGDDPLVWRAHLAAELCQMVGARAAFHDEERVGLCPEDSQIVAGVVLGLEAPSQMAGLIEYMRNGGFHIHPFYDFIQPIATRPWTRTRREIVADDHAYYGSRVISEYKRAGDIDDTIHSRQPIPRDGFANMIAVFREWGGRAFSVRDRRLVHLVHEELARLWKRPAPTDPADGLPPRLRQLVHRLRAGDGEKQIAQRLGLSRQTVHAYVKTLYRRLGVSSRVELLTSLTPPRATYRPRLGFEMPGAGDH